MYRTPFLPQKPEKVKKLDLNPSRPQPKFRADIFRRQEEDKKRKQAEEGTFSPGKDPELLVFER